MTNRILGRKKAHRDWLIRNLTTSVILYERVETTTAKAKEVRRWVDRMITLGKDNRLATRRRLLAWFPDPLAPKKIWEILADRYADRPSGYTRLFRTAARVGDNAPSMIIQLIPSPTETKPQVTEDQVTQELVIDQPKRRLPRLSKPKAKVTVRKKAGSK